MNKPAGWGWLVLAALLLVAAAVVLVVTFDTDAGSTRECRRTGVCDAAPVGGTQSQ